MPQPPVSMLCGDEVPAVVVDMGSCLSKFGSSGQDQPRHTFRSQVGVRDLESSPSIIKEGSSAMEVEGEGSEGKDGVELVEKALPPPKHLCGDMELRTLQDMEIAGLASPEGVINWDYVESVFRYGVESCMRLDMQEYPMMIAESMFTETPDKEALLELCFEQFKSPGVYVGRNAMLGSFSAGRQSSLVVDLGASGTRITPIVDGYALQQAIVTTSRGGDWLDQKLMSSFQKLNYDIKPWFQVPKGKNKDKDKKGSKKKGSSGSTAAPILHPSFVTSHTMNIIRDAKTWMCFVPNKYISGDEERQKFVGLMNMPAYELPDGTKVDADASICLAGEELIVGSAVDQPASLSDKLPLPSNARYVPPQSHESLIDPEKDGLPMLILSSLSKCDVDVRRTLLSHIVLIGGGSLMDGLTVRLQNELSRLLPSSMKPKVVPMLPLEKHKAAWIGGSVLSICGSFQQMWLSKMEWEEYGTSIIASRFNK